MAVQPGEGEASEEAKNPIQEEDKQRLIDEAQRKNDQLATSLKYLQADFENYRKRMEKEMKDVQDFATLKLVGRLLSVLDELELAISNGEASGESGVLLDGVRMVYKSLSSALEKEGLRRIDAVGRPFDPEHHEAIEKVPGDGEGDVVVVAEIRKGYQFKNQVIRPSMVKVKLVAPAATKSEVRVNE